MDVHNKLETLGLTTTESKLYIALLQIGESTAVTLAKHTSIHRRTIYDNLAILIKKGLVSYKLKDNVKYFQAINPQALENFLEEKRNTLTDILPQLLQLHKKNTTPPQITIIEGLQGAKSIIEEATKSKQPIHWMGGGLIFFDAIGHSKDFIKQKLHKTNIKIIQARTPGIEKKLNTFPKKNIKLLPEKYTSNIGYLIYDQTVALGLIQNNEITTIKIISEEFAEGFKKYFTITWNTKEHTNNS